MTTIALDKTHIAYDSQITVGDEKVAYPGEKVWIVGRDVYAFAGDYGLLDTIIDWHRKGARSARAPRDGAWDLLVITPKGAYLYSNEAPFKTPIIAPFAMGTGAPYARGAMLAGAAAYKAVKIACECDVYSGGEVNVLELAAAFAGRG